MSQPYGPPPSPNWQPVNPVPPPGAPAPYGGTQPPPPGAPGPGMAGPYGPPDPYGAPGPYGVPTPMPSARRRKRMLVILPLALVAFVVVAAKVSARKDNAAVGDCIKKVAGTSDSAKIQKIDCTDPTATYKIVGKVDHVSRISLNVGEQTSRDGKGVCGPFPTATTRFWRGDNKDGYALCLAPNQH